MGRKRTVDEVALMMSVSEFTAKLNQIGRKEPVVCYVEWEGDRPVLTYQDVPASWTVSPLVRD